MARTAGGTNRTDSLRVAMTGATGFIGSAVVTEMLERGWTVTALLRPDSNCARLAEMAGIDTLTYSRLLDEGTIRQLKEQKPDVFIHSGWRGVGGQDRNQAFQITGNLPATIDTVELAAAVGCRQWIGFGSQAEYGSPNCRTTEDAPLRPTTLYGKAKVAAGVAALALCEAHQIAGAWLRVFSVFGPDDALHWFIPYVTQHLLAGRSPLLTKCEQRWDYLYVADAAEAVASVASVTAHGVFNLGSGLSRPLKDYVEAIQQELNMQIEPAYGAVPYGPDQVMHLEADISRITAATNWQPRTSLADGIRAVVEFERVRSAVTLGRI